MGVGGIGNWLVKLVVAWSLAVKDNRLGVRNSVEQRSASMCHCPGPGHWLSLGHGTDLLTDLLPASTLGF